MPTVIIVHCRPILTDFVGYPFMMYTRMPCLSPPHSHQAAIEYSDIHGLKLQFDYIMFVIYFELYDFCY